MLKYSHLTRRLGNKWIERKENGKKNKGATASAAFFLASTLKPHLKLQDFPIM